MSEVVEGEVVDEETRMLPAVRAHEAMVTRAEVSVEDVIAQREKITAVMTRVMTDGTHYGRIPGVQKPTLFKAGAEVLNTTFRLAPSYTSERIFHDDGHLTVIAKCVLTHAPSGMVLAEGEGLCSSREAKYAYRNPARVCPSCGAEAIIRGKAEYGGGWLCWKNHKTNPGCGAKFADGDPAIEDQQTGKVANPDLADTWNTVLKMADKRALVAAVLNGTAASDIFTQDVEDSTSQPESFEERSAAAVADPPTDADGDIDYANVRVHFGTNTDTRVGDLQRRSREWYAGDGWASKKTESGRPVTDRDRLLRRACRVLSGMPTSEADGPFANEDEIPF